MIKVDLNLIEQEAIKLSRQLHEYQEQARRLDKLKNTRAYIPNEQDILFSIYSGALYVSGQLKVLEQIVSGKYISQACKQELDEQMNRVKQVVEEAWRVGRFKWEKRKDIKD